ncbi:MAG TPA: CotH kinase family protein, partial [Actinomycetes bacterium]|nr:CotH kinase family protein [Actinomycetes bacterium]
MTPDGEGERLAGMDTVNLKAMYNDPSQLREALAWRLFARVGVPASRHTYAKLALNDTYLGLFSVIEQVDKRYLKDRFGDNDEGNLYKAACGELGCATLERRVGPDGRDDGRQYIAAHADDQTYRLMTNEDDPAANTYEDLARLVRVVDGAALDGGEARFDSAAFRQSVEDVLNVRAFLRWAGVNVLIGSWDNYFATPSNYFLYNSGRRGDERGFMASPYFTFIPWDYDNSFGIDFFDTRWQDTDLVDWAASTANYGRRNSGGRLSRIPLVQHLLRNRDFLRYYLDHVEVPARHRAQPGRGRGPDRGRRRALGPRLPARLPGVRHPARVAVHRQAVHQPRGLPQQ